MEVVERVDDDNHKEEEESDSVLSDRVHLFESHNRTIRFINHQHLRYLFDSKKGKFVLLRSVLLFCAYGIYLYNI